MTKHRRPFVALVLAAFLAARGADAGDPAPVTVYLPFPADVSWRVIEGNNEGTHADQFNKFAFDFACTPEGQPVCAVMDGVVEFVKKDEREQTGNDKDNNRIVVRHEDGSLAEYVHLMKDGAFFDVGEKVVAGDVIGWSGNTGKSSGPHLHFGLRSRDKDGPSVPCRFVEVAGDGVPKTGDVVKSQNVCVRETPGWRELRGAIDLFRFCSSIEATSSAMPLLESAKRFTPRIQHPSFVALLKERDEMLDAHKQASVDASQKLKDAKASKDLDVLADLATYGPLDYADFAPFAKELRAIPAGFGKDAEWLAAMARVAPKAEYRRLVADAVKEEMAISSHFIPKKSDPRSRPDYAPAILAWEKARGKVPEAEMGNAIRRHGEALKTAR